LAVTKPSGDDVAFGFLLQSRDLLNTTAQVKAGALASRLRAGSMLAMPLGENLDDNGEMHEISVTRLSTICWFC
jgi:hypothetical protein